MAAVFDDRVCELGEGPLWHPKRQQLFWFDILGNRLLTRSETGPQSWQFDENVSAAGWVDDTVLLIASETRLFRFDLRTEQQTLVTALEADNPLTRSNDGRADPWGGFWIGTMGKAAEPDAGAIYRYYLGELRQLYAPITITNAICFAPDRSVAYFTDTSTRQVMRQNLDPETGWPTGQPEIFLDLTSDGLNPDGAVVDNDGQLWLAQWGASRVACYSDQGQFLRAIDFEAHQTSCPAFGGPDLTTLFCTSAVVGLSPDTLTSQPTNGMTFWVPDVAQGQAENRVIL